MTNTAAAQRSIEKRLASLSLKCHQKLPDPPNILFINQLKKTGLSIFKPVLDVGYFTWLPYGPYLGLPFVLSAEQITDKIEYDGKPKRLIDVKSLKDDFPIPFHSLEPQKIDNRFPYSRYEIAGLHVASQHRGVEMDEIHFCFGGSTLELLARREVTDPNQKYYVTRVPHSNAIIIINGKEYTADRSHFGYQFERLMTGGRMEDKDDLQFSEHMQVMMIGPYRVLFQAECDALYKEAPVEIKSSHPKYWGTKVMFQMISSGSPYLCQGIKFRGKLSKVNLIPLEAVAKAAFVEEDITVLEQNIIDNMTDLQIKMSNAEEGASYSVSFQNQKIHLELAKTRRAAVLPPIEIVRELTHVFDPSRLVW